MTDLSTSTVGKTGLEVTTLGVGCAWLGRRADGFQGLEAVLGALRRAGMPAAAGVHAIHAVLIYTTGFVAWELSRVAGAEQFEVGIAALADGLAGATP